MRAVTAMGRERTIRDRHKPPRARAASRRTSRRTSLTLLSLTLLVMGLAWSTAAAQEQPVRLEIRAFEGQTEVTGETQINVFPKGQKTGHLPVTRTPAGPVVVDVAPGFYDAQAILERKGKVAGIKWAEQLIVQRYPDEYGRHLEVINFQSGVGALQIRPAPGETGSTKGWSAAAYALGDSTKDVAKSVPAGEDLLLLLPGGRYDVKVTLADRTESWLKDVEVPEDRTRMKTWSAAAVTAKP